MSRNIYRKDLLKDNIITEELLSEIENELLELVKNVDFVVFDWDNAPNKYKNIFNYNGGDEDWMVIGKNDLWCPSWLEHTDSCHEPQRYFLNKIIVYVGSHA